MNKAILKFTNFLKQFLVDTSKKQFDLAKNKLLNDEDFQVAYSRLRDLKFSLIETEYFDEKIDRFVNESLTLDEKTKISLMEETLNHLASNNDKYLANYDHLSDLLLDSNLNRKEMFSVFKEIIKKDIEIMEKEESSKNHNIKLFAPEINEQLFEKYVNSEDYKNLLAADEKSLSKDDLDFKLRIIQFNELTKKLKFCFLTGLREIRTYYFAKEKTYDEYDIEKIIISFSNIGISDTLCQIFEEILKQDLIKRNEKKQNVTLHKPKNIENSKLSIQEYNKIIGEIETYYDIQSQSVIRPLTLDEIIYLVSLFFKARFEKREIIKHLTNIYKYQGSAYPDLLKEFLAYQEKIKISKNAFVKEDYETIKSYLKELVQIQDEESYLFWKEEIEKLYQGISNELGKEYDYEIEKGQELSRIHFKK